MISSPSPLQNVTLFTYILGKQFFPYSKWIPVVGGPVDPVNTTLFLLAPVVGGPVYALQQTTLIGSSRRWTSLCLVNNSVKCSSQISNPGLVSTSRPQVGSGPLLEFCLFLP